MCFEAIEFDMERPPVDALLICDLLGKTCLSDPRLADDLDDATTPDRQHCHQHAAQLQQLDQPADEADAVGPWPGALSDHLLYRQGAYRARVDPDGVEPLGDG